VVDDLGEAVARERRGDGLPGRREGTGGSVIRKGGSGAAGRRRRRRWQPRGGVGGGSRAAASAAASAACIGARIRARCSTPRSRTTGVSGTRSSCGSLVTNLRSTVTPSPSPPPSAPAIGGSIARKLLGSLVEFGVGRPPPWTCAASTCAPLEAFP
jgi:hypothetical protein